MTFTPRVLPRRKSSETTGHLWLSNRVGADPIIAKQTHSRFKFPATLTTGNKDHLLNALGKPQLFSSRLPNTWSLGLFLSSLLLSFMLFACVFLFVLFQLGEAFFFLLAGGLSRSCRVLWRAPLLVSLYGSPTCFSCGGSPRLVRETR